MDRRKVLRAGLLGGVSLSWLGVGRAEAADAATLKAVFLVKRRPGMEFEAFRAYSTGTHAPMVKKLPGLRRYEVAFFPPQDGVDAAFDSSATLYFDDLAAFQAALGSPEGEAALADQENFLDKSATVALFGADAVVFP
jgi:uncharacterized protein (TIGR02118 family)